METKENIRVKGCRGTWYVIAETVTDGLKYYLLESEQWGYKVPHLLVDAEMNIIAPHLTDDMYDNIEEQLDCSL